MAAGVRDKNIRVFEALRLQSFRIEQLLNRMPHRCVVIENAYEIRLWGHGISTGYQSKCLVQAYDTRGPTPMVPWGHSRPR